MRYRIGEYFVAALLVAFASLRDARLSELLFPTARVLPPYRRTNAASTDICNDPAPHSVEYLSPVDRACGKRDRYCVSPAELMSTLRIVSYFGVYGKNFYDDF